MESIYKQASEINKMLQGCKSILLDKDIAKSIVNNIETNMIHFSESTMFNRNFYMLDNQLYVAVSPKELGSYDFYKIVKEVI